MTSNDVDVVAARCPSCQGMELTRLDESNAMPIDVFRCHGCGTQFNIGRLREDGGEPEDLSLSAGQ